MKELHHAICLENIDSLAYTYFRNFGELALFELYHSLEERKSQEVVLSYIVRVQDHIGMGTKQTGFHESSDSRAWNVIT